MRTGRALIVSLMAVLCLVTVSVLTGGGPAEGAEPAVRTSAPLARQPASLWQWPLDPVPAVVRRFQIGPAVWSPGHRGADLSAVAGQAIRTPAAGIVRFAGMVAGRPVLTIDHGDGLVTSLEPVSTSLSAGTQVSAGQVIGVLSYLPGHCAPRSCLHWGVRRHGRYIDPLELVGWEPPVIILLPVSCCPE